MTKHAVETVSLVSNESSRLRLVVMTAQGTFASELPDSGALRIGRGRECEIRIDDESISRVHAVLYADPPVSIEDAGSRNGTVVLGARLGKGERLPLPLGGTIGIGRAILVLDRAQAPPTRETGDAPDAARWIVASEPMRRLFQIIDSFAPTLAPVLVLGEQGVGKDVVARAIHDRSPRARAPFAVIDCALPEATIERELFGHARGAFSGEEETKTGLFEAADGGTIYLDDVAELPLTTQAKVLRVLESGSVTPLGTTNATRVDVRFIASTDRELRTLVQAGAFREDLYFRLDGIRLDVPPLRVRTADIAPLAKEFASRAATQLGYRPPRISSPALAALEAYEWPGNVPELREVVERAIDLARGAPLLGPQHIVVREDVVSRGPTREQRDERDNILAALARTGGNQGEAAKLLGTSRATLIRRLAQYRIERPRKRT